MVQILHQKSRHRIDISLVGAARRVSPVPGIVAELTSVQSSRESETAYCQSTEEPCPYP